MTKTTIPIQEINYTSYIKGNLPIILSAPHGGDINAPEIKTRTSGIFDKDDFTKELTLDIVNEFHKQTNKYPYAVIMNLSRKKIDANRDIFEAIEMDDKNALNAYNSFHKAINNSFDEVKSTFKYGLYFDIHGQSHSHNCLELGYLLTNDKLKLEDKELKNYKEDSSLNSLSSISNKDFLDLLKGDSSFGTILCKNAQDSIPSSKIHYANDDKEYFEGAFNTQSYSQIGSPMITAIQCEFPYKSRSTKENRLNCAKAFVYSIIEYYKIHFDIDLKA